MKDKTWLGIGALILAVSAVLAVPQSAGAQVSSTGKFEYWGDIACPTSLRECDLVGATLPRSGATTGASTSTPSVLIERGHFNKPLTIVPTTTIGSLSAISCWNNGCKAVGNAQGKPLILVLRGGRWEEDTGVTTPGFLNAVTCRNATDCNAVGSIPGDGTLEARWDGHTWTIGPRTDPAGATNAVLLGVSCAAADDCTAVG